MIVKLIRQSQYGQMGQGGINVLPELNEEPDEFYAHSAQDALEWLRKFPMYKDSHISDPGNGRFIVTSQWMERNKAVDVMFSDLDLSRADYWHSRVIIVPVNTIHEATGFRVPDHE